MYTTSSAMLSALREAGVQYLFVNLGSDHSAFMEAYALARASQKGDEFPYPAVITCPNEMVALSAAHGHAAVSGQAQAVLVHVECGTQALAGAVHNAAKGRVPVLIMAGMSPATQEGEARGSRNEFIHWIQDVFDQRGIVRGYVRYDNEIRVGANAPQIVHRALQVASSDPKGPVYLVAAREILEQEVTPAARGREEVAAPGRRRPGTRGCAGGGPHAAGGAPPAGGDNLRRTQRCGGDRIDPPVPAGRHGRTRIRPLDCEFSAGGFPAPGLSVE